MITYDPGTDHDPLFPLDPAWGMTATARPTLPRAAALAACPSCAIGARKVGVITAGGHWVWAHHIKTTFAGLRIECTGSGVPLCQMPPRRTKGRRIGCPCGAGRADA